LGAQIFHSDRRASARGSERTPRDTLGQLAPASWSGGTGLATPPSAETARQSAELAALAAESPVARRQIRPVSVRQPAQQGGRPRCGHLSSPTSHWITHISTREDHQKRPGRTTFIYSSLSYFFPSSPPFIIYHIWIEPRIHEPKLPFFWYSLAEAVFCFLFC